MEPLTLATSFATIVGLLVDFNNIQDSRDLEDFIDWLKESHREDTARIIENNATLKNSLLAFLNQNHDEVMLQLSKLNDLMLTVASRIDGLDSIVKPFQNNQGLSDQAVSILRQFVNSQSTNMHLMKGLGRDYNISLILEGSSDIEYEEPRFIEDDVESLVNMNLIRKTFTLKGDIVYKITRQAVSFINTIDNETV